MEKLLQFTHLHPLIYVVADKPTKDNISPKVPLVGTASYRKFLEWVGIMDLDVTRLRLYNQCDNPFDNTLTRLTLLKAVDFNQIKIIALGQKAASYLNKVGIREYCLLPHPSLRNRLLNYKKFIIMRLKSCKEYIYET